MNNEVAGFPLRNELALREVGMTSFTIDIQIPQAQHGTITDDALIVDLMDGRTLSVPLV